MRQKKEHTKCVGLRVRSIIRDKAVVQSKVYTGTENREWLFFSNKSKPISNT